MYLWFFKSSTALDRLSETHPKLQEAIFIVLALAPVTLVGTRFLEESLAGTLRGISTIVSSVVLKHIIRSAAKPVSVGVQALLTFASVNLLVQAVPHDFAVTLPPYLSLLDPNGDGILTQAEIVDDVAAFSVGLLRSVFATCLSWYLILAKRPPQEYPTNREYSGVVHRLWRATVRRHAFAVILQLVTTLLLGACAAVVWFRFLGLSPATVLTFSGVGGLAFGFASQSLIGNLVGGLLILVTRPFKYGDFIQTGDVSGNVKRIGWIYTEVQTPVGPVVFVPNSGLVDSQSVNRTAGGARKVEVKVPVRFPPGGLERISSILQGLETEVRDTWEFEEIAAGPEANMVGFAPEDFSYRPVSIIQVEVDLVNAGLGEVDRQRSSLVITTMKYLKLQGCEIVGLEQ